MSLMQATTTNRSRFRDRVLLLSAAFLVCVIGGGLVLVLITYEMDLTWFFIAWNSILFVPAIGREFRAQFKRPLFVAFFVVWACLHGLFIVALMRRVPFAYWLPLIMIELFVGGFVASILFDIAPSQKTD